MHFDDEFIKSLPDEPREAVLAACKRYNQVIGPQNVSSIRHQVALEGHAFIEALLKSRGVPSGKISITGKEKEDIDAVNTWVSNLSNSMKSKLSRSSYEDYTNIYSIKLGTAFHFEFSDGDLKQIQKLINELRDLISATDEIASDHKQRLLKKLEKFQSEFYKKVSDLDRFGGFLLEASAAIGQAGENVKPVVDRIRELISIIWPVMARTYDLPSNLPFKLLGRSEDKASNNNS